ncbi:MAG: bifunctional DNA primase/polymerase [Chloroflexi bacterium]|nr:bifunctional DNA primase/polymerase [Chloroflexota bacterium]
MKSREKSLIDELKDRAKMLARAGFSPIPVHGDNSPTEPKRPAISWRQFQSRIATDAEVERDFNENVTALGVICGRVSKLIVVDFDDLLRYQRFCRHLPQYSETYTVQTRRGFHLYFRTSVKVPTHQFDGGDIKAERSYIIAPPSRIGNFVYRCVKNVRERDLDKADVDHLLNYFHVKSSVHVVTGKRTRERRDVNLKRVYGRLAPRIGRNNALYRVASIAREHGVSEMDAKRELLNLHAEAAGHVRHKVERLEERLQEGVRTIESAYSNGGSGGEAQSGIPNSVREQLLKAQRSTIVPRLLDAFALEGWETEAYFR